MIPFRISSSTACLHMSHRHPLRRCTTAAAISGKKYSLRTLSEEPVEALIDELCNRSHFQQHNVLRLPAHTDKYKMVLYRLLQDTCIKADVLRNLAQGLHSSTSTLSHQNKISEVAKIMDTLLARHAFFPETLSDVLFARTGDRLSDDTYHLGTIIQSILQQQARLTVCLEQLYFQIDNQLRGGNQELTPWSLPSSSIIHPFVRNLSVNELCYEVCMHAKSLAEHHESWCPEISIADNRRTPEKALVAIPSRLKFSLLELLKNALHSTMRNYYRDHPRSDESDAISNCSPVSIEINDDESRGCVMIRVIDRGVGMSPSELEHCYKFLWCSTRQVGDLVNLQSSYQPISSPLSGLGAGLCLSRIYMRQFGGQLDLHPNMLTSDCGALSQGIIASLLIPTSIDVLEFF